MGLGTQPATHRSPMARLVTSATPGDRDQAASARTQHLMLSTPAPRRCASRHAESLLPPALYPRRNPNSGRATKAPDRYHYLGARTSSSTRGPPPSSPSTPRQTTRRHDPSSTRAGPPDATSSKGGEGQPQPPRCSPSGDATRGSNPLGSLTFLTSVACGRGRKLPVTEPPDCEGFTLLHMQNLPFPGRPSAGANRLGAWKSVP
jgi:hypothetical protein